MGAGCHQEPPPGFGRQNGNFWRGRTCSVFVAVSWDCQGLPPATHTQSSTSIPRSTAQRGPTQVGARLGFPPLQVTAGALACPGELAGASSWSFNLRLTTCHAKSKTQGQRGRNRREHQAGGKARRLYRNVMTPSTSDNYFLSDLQPLTRL